MPPRGSNIESIRKTQKTKTTEKSKSSRKVQSPRKPPTIWKPKTIRNVKSGKNSRISKCSLGSKTALCSLIDSAEKEKYNRLIDDTYVIGTKFGSGSYGDVRFGTNKKTGQKCAIKFEKIKKGNVIQIVREFEFYRRLKGEKGFPQIFYCGAYSNGLYQVMVMELLGKDLATVFDQCNRQFTLKTIIFIILQLLKRFQVIHSAGIVYQDVKPENFLLSLKSNTIHVIDFGLSKFYLDENNRHYPCRSVPEITGTFRYMSIAAHCCMSQCRRDDLESLGYVILFFLRQGKLPWSGLRGATNTQQQCQMICDVKQSLSGDDLFMDYPQEFLVYFRYIRSLSFEAKPNYEKIRNMFKRLFRREDFKDDGIYDWNQS